MIVDERMVTYINSLDMGNTPLLNEIEKEAKADLVPVIRREMQSFLKVLLAIHRPLRVLEVGTAVGFSALLICEYGPENMQVTTIEKYEKRIPIARENFRRAGRENQITLLEGDAADILKERQESYDLILMDAAKGQYQAFLPHCLRLLPVRGLLIVDDVLQGGTIAQTRFSVPRRQRTIHKRLRNFLWEITHHDALETSIIPIGDGVALCYKKKEIIPETKTEGETKNAE